MKFYVVEITEGGAQGSPTNHDGVREFLAMEPKYWRKALGDFERRTWEPGDAMAFPCGWIFCVNTARGLGN